MLRIYLIFTGFLILLVQHFVIPISEHLQFAGFLIGIILLGIPHGSADMLVASQNESEKSKFFSGRHFLIIYIGRLLMFSLFLFLFPLAGILFFICFAAYHFGETDLYFFKTENLSGKILVVSYGLVIVNIILFNNLIELKTLLHLSGINWLDRYIFNWAMKYRVAVLSFSVLLFFGSIFYYFLKTGNNETIPDSFIFQFAFLVFILYNLPLVAGFTFYFILWHSVLSLRNIIFYLLSNGQYSIFKILKQIGFFSSLAFTGIFISGSIGFMFLNNQRMMMWIFGGLAVLTAPHMQVMHNMYLNIRLKRDIKLIKN